MQLDEKPVKPQRLPSDELLTDKVNRRIEVLQSLIEPCDRKTYGIKKREAARKLGVSLRQVERLLQKWREHGLVGLTATRSDKGKYRLEQDWVDFIINTYTNGNKGSKRMTRHQVFMRVKGRAKQLALKKGEYPSHQSVYRILDQHIEQKDRKRKARSPGYSGERLTHMTRDGRELEVEGSNDVWQCDHTRLDIRLVDEYGVLDRPWLTIIIDSYSRCVMGFYLGFDHPSSQIDALALRHAILPKSYGSGYQLRHDWGTYGKPNHFYTDGGKDFTSIHITEQVAVQIGFNCSLRRRPSDGGIVERFFRTLNDQVLRDLPGYTGSNVQQRPATVDKDARLTLKGLETILVRYIVDEYNQHVDARSGNQSRLQRWEGGLMVDPYLYDELDLAICLMKQERRTVQKYGRIRFGDRDFAAEHLRGRAGELVTVRFDPDDITTLFVYQRNADGTEELLDYAHALDLETERLSLRELKARNKKRRETGEEINNSILDAMLDRDEFVENLVKRNRQQRKQAAQEQVNPTQSVAKKFAISKPEEIEAKSMSEAELEVELPRYQVRFMDDLFEDD
ncbi:DDE-type integrase/transposase/recombinase [Scytonema millei VB511283]|uniref:DDE-type integrase/transposase/recombinase n=1 Tax=Scytonema millei VB511283 TaxID=1245923 RepID=A0A9X5E7R6_9CYAN|nr:DDE-type integrase/transposase/recombinase [Scytonema millei VB511283]